ncbi:DNA polymerase kappa-like [Dendronephthya gigantea]|uniref:DNA polymerase kappa-like n=1 Tax=Dendronephthya gigantea TaxID=151771 RepID=UPI0010699D3B|nr:DNA polymerase kappa-like [Dendronephthya gigantea]
MAADEEEFDFSSDDENFENDWKFDENYDNFENTNASATPLDADTDGGTLNAKNNATIDVMNVGEFDSNKQKVSRMDLNTTKAGMEGLDKEKINQIIHDASKGSKFYENEKKKEKQVQKRIEELQRKLASYNDEQKLKAKQDANKIVRELEQCRDLTRTIVHVDMDAFYAAVEMRDDPSLKSKPMAVGGNDMLCTSNYLARRYGVRAGMPGFIAKKLCPNLIIVRANFDKYTKISHEIREVLAEYDRNFLPMSLDEAYMDITEYLNTLNRSEDEKGIVKVESDNSGESSTIRKQELTKFGMLAPEDNMDVDRNTRGFIDTAKDAGSISIKQEDFSKMTAKWDTDLARISANQYEVKEEENKKDEELVLVTPNVVKEKSMSDKDFKELHESMTNEIGYKREPSEEKQESSINEEEFYTKVEEVVNEMRRKIEEKTQLTASAGIAPNMFLAKVCSDKNKPNGQFYLKPKKDKIMAFVRELPLRKAFGIGRVSEQILTSILKVNTCFDLHKRRDLMQLLFSPTACRNYLEISLGLGSTVVNVDRERKSMSTETTFREISEPEEHFSKCRELCQELSESLKAKGLTGRKIGIKLKTVHFEVKTRVCTASFPVQEADDIFPHARKLLANEIRACSPEPLRLRLMGVRVADFCEKSQLANESKQPTILSLMKKRGASCNSSNLNSEPNEMILDEHIQRPDEPCGQPETSADENVTMKRSSFVKPAVKQTTFNCPVCGIDLTFKSSNPLLQMNQHVEMCLSKRTSSGLVKYDLQTNKGKQTSKKRKRESSSNPNKMVKKNPMDRFLTKNKK